MSLVFGERWTGGGEVVESAAGEEDACVIGVDSEALAEGADVFLGGGVDEGGGEEFGHEKGVAAVAIDVVGVGAEAEGAAGEVGKDRGGGGGGGGPGSVDVGDVAAAEFLGGADGVGRAPEGVEPLFGGVGDVAGEVVESAGEEVGAEGEFAGEGPEER